MEQFSRYVLCDSDPAGCRLVCQTAHPHASGGRAVYYASDMPGFWTGLYKLDSEGKVVLLLAYDVFRYFGKLYELGYEVKPDKVSEDTYVLAATGGKKEMGIMVVNDSAKSKEVDVRIKDVCLDECQIQVKGKKVQATDEKIKLRLTPYEVSFVNILTQ